MITAALGATAGPWVWSPHPGVWLLVIALGAGYAAAVRVVGPRVLPYGEKPATRRQQVTFFVGLALLWAGADWPLHELSEDFLLSAHMVQHLLFTLVAPPLMLLGMPVWLLRGLLSPRVVFAVVAFLTRPLVALVTFNGVIAITHWPFVVDASLRSEPVHFGVHLLLFTTATMMWWPVVAPLPETPSLSEPAKMLYVFLQSIVPTVPASFLTFADSPIYKGYAGMPRIWEWMDVVTDQRIAGLIMKVVGGLLLWGVIAVIFFRWSAREEARDRGEIAWDDFERELEAFDLRK